MTMLEPINVGDMSVKQINALFRENDESDKFPVYGQFNATERAIRRLRRKRREGLEVHAGLEYYLAIKNELFKVIEEVI